MKKGKESGNERKINQPKGLPEKKLHSLPSAEKNLGEILSPNSNLGKKFDFSIDGLGNFEAIEISGDKLGIENGFVDRKFFFSDKWKNLKGEMEQQGYNQPTREEFSKLIKSAGGVEKLDELMGGILSIPGVRLELDQKSRCRPFAVNNPYFNIFRDGIVYDGYKHPVYWKSIQMGDMTIPGEKELKDYSYLYRDHEKGKVLFIKKK